MLGRDVLLLEAGFVTVLVAPLNWFGLQQQQQQQRRRDEHHCHDSIAMQLVRWLLFRLSFASAVATLYSVTDSSSLLAGIYTDHYVSCRYAPFLFTSASCVRSIAAVLHGCATSWAWQLVLRLYTRQQSFRLQLRPGRHDIAYPSHSPP